MATPIATVNIALRTATVSRAGFGTPIFISSHRSFQERVRTYRTLTAVGEDFEANSNTYIAAQGFFASTPSPAQIKIGRREADLTLTPENVSENTQYTITVSVNDGDSVTATYTALVADTAEEVVDAIKAAIDADADVTNHVTTTKIGVGSAATLTIQASGVGDVFDVSDVNNLSQSFASTEDAGVVLQAVRDVDDDFYFVTAEDHSAAFVIDMADAVQAMEKLYFVSTQEQDSITTPYSVASTDILAKLKINGYTRTAGFWSQDADTKFRECNYVGYGAPYSPDVRAIVWGQVELAGVPLAQNADGNQLTATQQLNLDNRNASYVRYTAAGNRVEGGKFGSGRWIDQGRILDCMTARVREGQVRLFANQAGSKVPGNAAGISLAASALTNSLNPFVASEAINGFTVDTSNAVVDAATRTLNGMTFEAILSDGIIRVAINGDLISQDQGA